jgi:hypothetical protein
MKYSILVSRLRQFEAAWPHPTSAAPAWVRSASNVQYVALRERADAESEPDLDVVVDLGINYTQGKSPIPGLAVVDNVPYVNERKAVAHCNADRPAWLRSALVSPKLPANHLYGPAGQLDPYPVQDFHLVMTNFSPWITKDSWASQMCANSAGLGPELLMNPPYSPRIRGWPFDHLDDFVSQFRDDVALWIGHGLESVPTLFRLFVDKHAMTNWMLCANLSMPGSNPTMRAGFVKFK